MVGIYPKIQFEQVDWSPLGRLPAVAQEAEIQRARRSLADLDVHTIKGLEDASQRLLGAGDIEGGMKYLTAAQARRETERKSAADALYMDLIKKLPGIPAPGAKTPSTAAEETSSFDPFPTPGVVTPPPSATPWNAPRGVVPGTEGSIPAEPGTVQVADLDASRPFPPPRLLRPPGVPPTAPEEGGPSVPPLPIPPGPMPQGGRLGGMPGSSEELLARAEGGAVPLPQGPQLAGPPSALPPINITPGPKPPVPPGPAVPGVPEWLVGAQKPAFTEQPLGGRPEVAPAPAPKYGKGPAAETQRAQDELAALGAKIRQLSAGGPKVISSPEYQATILQFKDALSRMKMSDEDKSYQLSRLQRFQNGDPDISKDEYKFLIATGLARFDELKATSKAFEEESKKGRDLRGSLEQLDTIMKNPKFASGNWSETMVRSVGSTLNGLKSSLIAMGVPQSVLPNIDSITGPAALQEVYKAIVNQAVYNKFGSLGNQVSNSDRTFVTDAFPGLGNTIQGNKLIVEGMLAMADRAEHIGRLTRGYRINKGDFYANSPQMQKLADDYNEANPIFRDKSGKLTPLGEKLSKEVGERVLSPGEQVVKQRLEQLQKEGTSFRMPGPPTPGVATGGVLPGQSLAPNQPPQSVPGPGVPLPRPRPYIMPPQQFPVTRNPRMRQRLEDLEF